MIYCRSFRFDDRPDYAYLRRMLKDLRMQSGNDMLIDGLRLCMLLLVPVLCNDLCAAPAVSQHVDFLFLSVWFLDLRGWPFIHFYYRR